LREEFLVKQHPLWARVFNDCVDASDVWVPELLAWGRAKRGVVKNEKAKKRAWPDRTDGAGKDRRPSPLLGSTRRAAPTRGASGTAVLCQGEQVRRGSSAAGIIVLLLSPHLFFLAFGEEN
jgi:hypothetical protein